MKQKVSSSIIIYLEMIKFQHSIFALPFAMIGMLWAANGWPGTWKFFWIIVAMISCRAAAMTFNRIVDHNIDSINPRTASRPLPAGLIKIRQVNIFLILSIFVFILSAGMLNKLALQLSPLALTITLFYSYTKRFTMFSHSILGLSLGIAPVAAWIGVKGTIDFRLLVLMFAVMFWTSGFDIIYSLQDEEFDRKEKLYSIPQSLGAKKALIISRFCHVLAIFCLIYVGLLFSVSWIYYLGVLLSACVLFYEQSIVKPNDLSKLNVAFFTANGIVSIGLFCFTLMDLISRSYLLI